MRKEISIFDTTLRDGTQGEKVAFSAGDKVRIAQKLDDFGIDYIEGGWPGSNPKDMAFFERAKTCSFNHAKIVAFGSTCRAKNEPGNDPNINALIEAETPAVAIFGKSWPLHVEQALNITPERNLGIIADSISYLKQHDKEVIYDAEHFFDGYKNDPAYALSTIQAAAEAGADVVVLCDTNGGTLPHEISSMVHKVKQTLDVPLGIHAHNDCELGVANALAAVDAGCVHVQGTINGYGERCGNANLCSIIPNLQLKQDYQCIDEADMDRLGSVSRFVSELANLNPDIRQPYVGRSAFAHKGGVHVSAVMKNARTYEHIAPEVVGNKRRVLVSDLSGKSNIRFKAEELGVDLDKNEDNISQIVQELKELENKGYEFEGADASFELLVQNMSQNVDDYFALEGFRVTIEQNAQGTPRTEASIRLVVDGQNEHCAAEGDGPVQALDFATRKALRKFYPEIDTMHLQDYKVRVLGEKDGTGSAVRVLIESGQNGNTWGTVGVSENILEASWEALSDSFRYFLVKHKPKAEAVV